MRHGILGRWVPTLLATGVLIVFPVSPGTAQGCPDSDGDGYCEAVDCDDTAPNCNVDCTDVDGDGYCPPYDCDDSEPDGADTDGDGVPDRCDSCPFHPDQGQSDFDAIDREIVIGNNLTNVRSLVAVDLDGDGDVDVLTAGYNDIDGGPDEGTLELFRSSAGGASWSRETVEFVDGFRFEAVTADLEQDGDPDILYSGMFFFGWMRNVNGLGIFDWVGEISSLHGRTAILAADIDGDGDSDVLASGNSASTDSISWWENVDPPYYFGPAQTVSADADYLHDFAAGDLDGDGDMDIVAGTGDHAPYNKVLWLENLDGRGTFGPEITIGWLETYAVAVADLDGDADLDILANSLPDFHWFENTDGAGTFAPGGIVVPGSNYHSAFVVADLDGDGDNDLLTTAGWHENLDGMGSFGPEIEIPGMTTPLWVGAVAVADLDGDGDLDVVAERGPEHKISWFEARGDGVADVCDCAPSDPAVFQPSEVTPITLARPEPRLARMLWDEVRGADSYSITRGLLSQIGPGHYGSCLIQGVTDTHWDDGDDPGSGEGFNYLVRAERGACGSGPLGFTSDGAARNNLDPHACP